MDIEDVEQAQQIENLKKKILDKILTKEAMERLSRVRLVNPQLSLQVELYLVQLFQAGKIKGIINDTKIKEKIKILG
jgi:DNA-binding TFAR19-related protein (PDSD5 family)